MFCLSVLPSADHPLLPQGSSPSLRLGQEEKGEKSSALFESSSPFPGLLTPISFGPTIGKVSGHVPQYSDFYLLSPQLPVRVEAGAALPKAADFSSFQ